MRVKLPDDMHPRMRAFLEKAADEVDYQPPEARDAWWLAKVCEAFVAGMQLAQEDIQ